MVAHVEVDWTGTLTEVALVEEDSRIETSVIGRSVNKLPSPALRALSSNALLNPVGLQLCMETDWLLDPSATWALRGISVRSTGGGPTPLRRNSGLPGGGLEATCGGQRFSKLQPTRS